MGALVLLVDARLCWDYLAKGPTSPPTTVLIPYGLTASGISLATLATLFCLQNYYLLDPVEHRLYHQFQFLWWRRRRIVFRQEEILGLTTEGQMVRSRHGRYWHYRLTVVGIGGRQEPLSDWRREGLEKWNAKAVELAAQLGCQSYAAPSQSAVSVELKDGKPTWRFSPAPPASSRRAVGIFIFAVVFGLLYYVILVKARR